MPPRRQQRPPTPTPPCRSRLPRGASTRFGPGSPSLSPAPLPHPLLPLQLPLSPLLTSALAARRLVVNQEYLEPRSSKPIKPNPVFKRSVLPGKKQPQSVCATVLWAYAPVCTESRHWGAGRRLKTEWGGGRTPAEPQHKRRCRSPSWRGFRYPDP